MKYIGKSVRASCHVYYKTRGFLVLYMYVFYITTTPHLPFNKNHMELYDFYYMLVTLTTGDIQFAIAAIMFTQCHAQCRNCTCMYM